MQEKLNWQIDNERREFLHQLFSMISHWKGQLPDLHDIFRPKEIDLLLSDSISYCDRCHRTGDGIGVRFISFVASTGYKDNPVIDADGKPSSRRTTAVHHAARKGYGVGSDVIPELFKIYDRFDVNYTDEDGLTHFHAACQFGLYEVVQKFLELGQDPNCLGQKSVASSVDPPLHLTLGSCGSMEIIKLLLKSGADPNSANKDGSTILHRFREELRRGDRLVTVGEMLFDLSHEKFHPVQVDARDKKGNTPLHMALGRNFRVKAEFLLRRGANPNLANAEGLTPLHVVSERVIYYDAMELIFKISDELNQRVEVNARDKKGNTPLHLALQSSSSKELAELLLRRGANLNLANEEGLTALHLICKSLRYYDLTKMILELIDEKHRSAQVNSRDQMGNTPLHFASGAFGDNEVIELLLRHGADPNAANAEGLTPLHMFCKRKYDSNLTEIFFNINDELNQLVEVDARDILGRSPLNYAVDNGHKKAIESLLRRGPDKNWIFLNDDERTSWGSTPKRGGDIDVVMMLFELSEEKHQLVNRTNEDGSTPLHIICSRDNERDDLAKILFKLGDVKHQPVQINAQDKSGDTPLHLVLRSKYNRRWLVELLLRKGANPNLTNNEGSTALHIVCKNYFRISSEEILRMFLKFKDELNQTLQVNVQDKSGNTPLHLALQWCDNALLRILLKMGVDINLANEDGLTPLHIIISQKIYDNKLVDMLLEFIDNKNQPVQIDSRDKSGNTPLHLALKEGEKKVADLLLRRGANPNLANAEGSTPLHYICQRYLDDDFAELFFQINDENHQLVKVDARDKLGRTPLQLAVANLLPKTVDVLLDRGADLSSFIFPDSSYFGEKINFKIRYESVINFKFRLTSGALSVVECLEKRGYELDRNEILTIMKCFDNKGLFKIWATDHKEHWYDVKELTKKAKTIMINPSLSLYGLSRLRLDEAEKRVTYSDFEFAHRIRFWSLPPKHQESCVVYLCEIVSRRFFRRWALDPFMELTHFRLPILCCEMIIKKLSNEDLRNICMAAADQSS
ncbi:ankyrin-1-like [Trichogramma pretiosum]|uniref:ankyrin-1-like n=1 Tax=Trichogramma pretiosum TaxID=7493 RepID=UPI000C7198B9|nr:ankyrin-1-like [Trichogramma pretiosum]